MNAYGSPAASAWPALTITASTTSGVVSRFVTYGNGLPPEPPCGVREPRRPTGPAPLDSAAKASRD